MPIDVPPDEWFKMKSIVEGLDKIVNGNGKPPLWDRMKEYVDQRDTHKERNMQQEMIDLRHEIDGKHTENRETLKELMTEHKSIQRLVYIGMGIMIALESVGLFKK